MPHAPHPNTIEKAKKVHELVLQWYEAGRQDRGYSWIYKNRVKNIYPMSERTYHRYLKIIRDLELNK